MKQQANDEYNALLLVPKLPAATNILKCHASRGLTILGKVALDYLATLTSSLPSECASSIAPGIWDNRSRLSEKIFHAETCVCLWMKFFDTLCIDLPKNTKKFSGLDHEAMFGEENEDNILDPIIMPNDSNGAYVPLE